MTCADVVSLLPAHLDGELDRFSRTLLERHLSTCANCGCYMAQYRATVAVIRAAFTPRENTTARHVPEELVGAILWAGGL